MSEVPFSSPDALISVPSLARALGWFTFVHLAPLVLIAADVLPSKLTFAIAHADTSRATETRPTYDLLAVCECAQDTSVGGIRGRRECGAKSSE